MQNESRYLESRFYEKRAVRCINCGPESRSSGGPQWVARRRTKKVEKAAPTSIYFGICHPQKCTSRVHYVPATVCLLVQNHTQNIAGWQALANFKETPIKTDEWTCKTSQSSSAPCRQRCTRFGSLPNAKRSRSIQSSSVDKFMNERPLAMVWGGKAKEKALPRAFLSMKT